MLLCFVLLFLYSLLLIFHNDLAWDSLKWHTWMLTSGALIVVDSKNAVRGYCLDIPRFELSLTTTQHNIRGTRYMLWIMYKTVSWPKSGALRGSAWDVHGPSGSKHAVLIDQWISESLHHYIICVLCISCTSCISCMLCTCTCMHICICCLGGLPRCWSGSIRESGFAPWDAATLTNLERHLHNPFSNVLSAEFQSGGLKSQSGGFTPTDTLDVIATNRVIATYVLQTGETMFCLYCFWLEGVFLWSGWNFPVWCSGGWRPLIAGCFSLQRLTRRRISVNSLRASVRLRTPAGSTDYFGQHFHGYPGSLLPLKSCLCCCLFHVIIFVLLLVYVLILVVSC